MGMLGSRIRRKAARFEYNKETPRAFGVDRESKSGRSQVVGSQVVGIFLQCLLTDSFLFGSSTQQRTYFLDKCLWGVGGAGQGSRQSRSVDSVLPDDAKR